MNDLFGFTRDIVKARYALRTPVGFVPSLIPGWKDAACIVQISEAMGARFCQMQVTLQKGSEGNGNTGSLEYVVYVLTGKCTGVLAGKTHNFSAGSYVYIPPSHDFRFHKPEPGFEHPHHQAVGPEGRAKGRARNRRFSHVGRT